jgi:hypothetical protein
MYHTFLNVHLALRNGPVEPESTITPLPAASTGSGEGGWDSVGVGSGNAASPSPKSFSVLKPFEPAGAGQIQGPSN